MLLHPQHQPSYLTNLTLSTFLQAKIDKYLSSSKQTKALILLRQLKFVETTMFQSGNPYNDQQSSANLASSTTGSASSEPIATDAEVILIDML